MFNFCRLLSVYIAFFAFFVPTVGFAQKINSDSLKMEILGLNDKNQHEQSILVLDRIIGSSSSTAHDLFHAYLLRSLTYKSLYNYTGALINLDLAEKVGRKTDFAESASSRILIEKLFIYFDTKRNEEFAALLEQVTDEKLKHIDGETRAFYECIRGHLEMHKGNYSVANSIYDFCIMLLEKENPKHLPIVYKVKVELYNLMGQQDKAFAAYEKGMSYAEQFGIDLYKITMLETIIYFYANNGNYKDAYLAQLEVTKQRRKYDAANRSGKLNDLEKELLQQRNDITLKNRKNMTVALTGVIVLLCALLFLLFKLLKSNKQRRILMENEVVHMRARLESYVNRKEHLEGDDNMPLNLEKYDLKKRHIEIINLIREGKTNKEIGSILFISENTVKYHLKIIFEKLNIDNRSSLIK
ncbi:MAG: helix-turn-helix transcriptional regulator [Sphingobacterium sp.]|jgi:DNA-binding CsgD family transcriptional regulator|nr:helix-turn-helix transcriptional regulator [Sphingobacterium sp.]